MNTRESLELSQVILLPANHPIAPGRAAAGTRPLGYVVGAEHCGYAVTAFRPGSIRRTEVGTAPTADAGLELLIDYWVEQGWGHRPAAEARG